MRFKVLVFFMVSLVVSLSALSNLAQAEEQQPQLYLIWDIVINPSKLAEYDAADNEMLSLFTKHKFPYPLHTYRTDDFHDYFFTPIENHAAIDDIYKHFAQIPEEEWSALVQHFSGTYESERIKTVYLRHDLSYIPENPRLEPEETSFMYWAFGYVLQGKETEFEEIFKEWVALYKSENIRDGFITYVGSIGTDNPIYIWTEKAKSASDFWTQHDKNLEKMGEEKVMALWNKTLALLRKYEFKTGSFRPDLSYIPKK